MSLLIARTYSEKIAPVNEKAALDARPLQLSDTYASGLRQQTARF
jgi:hypothetical protein